MMNRLKKIFLTTLLTSTVIIFASDYNYQSDRERKRREQQYALEVAQAKRSVAVWSGIAGFVGAVAGVAVGSWLASFDEQLEPTAGVVKNCNSEEVSSSHLYIQESLSPRAVQIKSQLDALAKYGQSFDLRFDCIPGINQTINEKAIVLNLHKLGFQLHQIDETFYHKLAQDYKILHDAGYSIWWHGLKSLEAQKDCYLSNSKQLIAYFNRHQEFIHCCQIVNAYDSLPLHACDLPSWIYGQNHDNKYPIIAYKNKIEADLNILLQFQRNNLMRQTNLMERVCATQSLLDHVMYMINSSMAYRQELDQKRHEELLEESHRIEKERLEIAKKQIQVQEQANKIAAEKNKIERERNQFYRDDRQI